MVGRLGRVTGTVGPGLVGEVMIPVRGGVEAFYAAAANPEETIPVGTSVLVVEYHPPRDVTVTRVWPASISGGRH
jgi:hypothetical protein